MTCREIQSQWDAYREGLLAPDERDRVEQHLRTCAECRRGWEELRSMLDEVQALPKNLEPARDLWPGIALRLAPRKVIPLKAPPTGPALPPRVPWWRSRVFAAAAMVTIAVGTFVYSVTMQAPAWNVAPLEGVPRLGREELVQEGRMQVGEWLETDAHARARVEVGTIGEVQVEPNSRLRLVGARATDHRVALARGTIQATIWAPPRIFFVETPSATAIDLGCAYTLAVDDEGGGLLHVTAGWVALVLAGREAVIPAGAMCLTRPGVGPGTPFAENADSRLREALYRLDFQRGGTDDLRMVLASAQAEDAVTLWHLLSRVDGAHRPDVYDRLAALAPPPAGVTREGVLQGEPTMMDRYGEHLGLGSSWWPM